MYFGRVVCVGQTHDEHLAMFYRLASQSYPDRKIVGDVFDQLDVVGKDFEEGDRYPRDSILHYPAFVRVPDYIVLGNGDHTKPIINLLLRDDDPKQALGTVLGDLGPEEDEQKTPRLVGVIHQREKQVWIGIVGEHSLHVEVTQPRPGGWLSVASEFRDRQYIAAEFQPVYLAGLSGFAKGSDQGTMSTVIVIQTPNGFEVKVTNY